jgi:outer membrane biogenesis lipoprotein LolB
MTKSWNGFVAAAVLLLLTGCIGESERPQEYMIDQDIDASHGVSIPTFLNQGAHGFESWRMKDPDTFGFSQRRW